MERHSEERTSSNVNVHVCFVGRCCRDIRVSDLLPSLSRRLRRPTVCHLKITAFPTCPPLCLAIRLGSSSVISHELLFHLLCFSAPPVAALTLPRLRTSIDLVLTTAVTCFAFSSTMASSSSPATNFSTVRRDSEMHEAYVFLCNQSVETLRDIYKFWNVPEHFSHNISGKAMLVAQIMTFMYKVCVTKQLTTPQAVLEGSDRDYKSFEKRWVVVYQDRALPFIPALSDIASSFPSDVGPKVKRFPELLIPGRSFTSQRPKRKTESPAKGINSTPRKKSKLSKSTAVDLPKEIESVSAVPQKGKHGRQKSFTLSEFTRLILLIRDDPEC